MTSPSTPNTISGRSAFIELLQSEGVTHLFGNPGTTELPIMHALADYPDMRYVLGLQEVPQRRPSALRPLSRCFRLGFRPPTREPGDGIKTYRPQQVEKNDQKDGLQQLSKGPHAARRVLLP
jgi:hypothetical protein